MYKAIVTFIGVVIFSGLTAQTLDPSYYRLPLDIPIIFSGNFAEFRTDHFHGGVDLKTGGVEGKNIYAVAEGYISRIGVSPGGYGRVLYVDHPNGTTSVYGHLSKFRADIEEFVRDERLRLKRNSLNIVCPADKFRVGKGDIIALSGNSGSSGGPHLHFEIRETAAQRTLNLVKERVIQQQDDIPPSLVRLYYVRVDTLMSVPIHAAPRRINLTGEVVNVAPNGYFVAEVTDRKNGTNNTMGLYRIEQQLDGITNFECRFDGFLFTDTRYINAMAHYGLQRGTNEFYRLAVLEHNRLPLYDNVISRGAISLSDNDIHNVRLILEDDSDNVTTVSFRIRRESSTLPPDATIRGRIVRPVLPFRHNAAGVEVYIPPHTLYEPVFFNFSVDSSKTVTSDRVRVLTDIYTILDRQTPLHTPMTVTLSVPGYGIGSKVCLASVSATGGLSYAGGVCAGGFVTGYLNRGGAYCAVIDDTPPRITPLFRENSRVSGSLSFRVSDDFSGMASVNAFIDGNWVILEQKQQGYPLVHTFDPSIASGRHELRIVATDNCGNYTVYTTTFWI